MCLPLASVDKHAGRRPASHAPPFVAYSSSAPSSGCLSILLFSYAKTHLWLACPCSIPDPQCESNLARPIPTAVTSYRITVSAYPSTGLPIVTLSCEQVDGPIPKHKYKMHLPSSTPPSLFSKSSTLQELSQVIPCLFVCFHHTSCALWFLSSPTFYLYNKLTRSNYCQASHLCCRRSASIAPDSSCQLNLQYLP